MPLNDFDLAGLGLAKGPKKAPPAAPRDATRVASEPGDAIPHGLKRTPSESAIDAHGTDKGSRAGITLTGQPGESDVVTMLGKKTDPSTAALVAALKKNRGKS